MNRATRRAADRLIKRGARTGMLRPGFQLVGGPMDGWYVKPDAPALEPDWWTTWPDSVRSKWESGRYQPTDPTAAGVQLAEWRPYEGAYNGGGVT